jgi:tetratricopeptide (TPR) repeat protein
VLYSADRNYRDSIGEFQKVIALDSRDGYALNHIAYGYLGLNDYDQALEYFQRYAAVAPLDANPLDSMGELCVQPGRLDEAAAQFEKALAVKPNFGSEPKIAYVRALQEDYGECLRWIDRFIDRAASPGVKASGFIWKGVYSYWLGDLERSMKALDTAGALWASTESEDMRPIIEGLKGWIYQDAGDFRRSRDLFTASMEGMKKHWLPPGLPLSVDMKFSFIPMNLKEGRTKDAKDGLAEIKGLANVSALLPVGGLIKDWLASYGDLMQAEVFLSEGSPRAAIGVLEQSKWFSIPTMDYVYLLVYNIPFTRDVLARAYLQNGQPDEAIATYERMITFDAAGTDRRLINPKDRYRLALLYEKRGLRDKSVAQLERFLELWRTAPEGEATKSDARRRLARLKPG